jgi:hypothetical protein
VVELIEVGVGVEVVEMSSGMSKTGGIKAPSPLGFPPPQFPHPYGFYPQMPVPQMHM